MKNIADETADMFDHLRKVLGERAQETGYVTDLFRQASRECDSLPDDPILDGTIGSFTKFRDYAKRKKETILSIPKFDLTAFTIVASASATAATAFSRLEVPMDPSKGNKFPFPLSPPLEPPDVQRVTAARFEKRDPELARVYRSVWEGLRGTTANPERVALFQMRQTFDHFFDRLAPDEEVRKSRFFSLKDGDKPYQIYRSERIQCAADQHIADKAKADLLAGEVEQILKVYEELNKAHTRGPLDSDAARSTVFAMDGILRAWLDAISW